MTLEIGIYDHSTGEQTTREMTQAEADEYAQGAIAKAEREAAEATAKQDKLAILASLGLTEEQAITLGLIEQERPKRILDEA